MEKAAEQSWRSMLKILEKLAYGSNIFQKTWNGNLVIWDAHLPNMKWFVCLWNFESSKLWEFETKNRQTKTKNTKYQEIQKLINPETTHQETTKNKKQFYEKPRNPKNKKPCDKIKLANIAGRRLNTKHNPRETKKAANGPPPVEKHKRNNKRRNKNNGDQQLPATKTPAKQNVEHKRRANTYRRQKPMANTHWTATNKKA